MRYATETSVIQFLFSFTSRWITILNIFSDPEKNPLDYSLWFLQNIDETMTAGYFLGGGILPPLFAVFPPFKLAVIIVYYNYFPNVPKPEFSSGGEGAKSSPP